MILSRYRFTVFIPMMIITSLILGLMIFQHLSSLSIWDDAYMFVRYARNLTTDGQIAWNPGGIATYGLTSIAYLLVVIPFNLLFPKLPALTLICSSLVCGITFFIAIISLLRRLIMEKSHFYFVLVFVSISCLVATEDLAVHFTSGMDTTFAMLMMTMWLCLLYFSDRSWLLGATGALFFFIRPDLLIVVVLVIAVDTSSTATRGQRGAIVLAFAIVLTFQLILTSGFLHSTLPLPFYAKRFGLYGVEFYGYYQNSAIGFFFDFLRAYPYMWMVILASLVTSFRQWTWHDRGLLLGVVVFCLYHILFVVPIMGFNQRFYYPIVPVIWILGAKSLIHLLRFIPARVKDGIAYYPLPVLILAVLLIPAFINPLPVVKMVVQFANRGKPPTAYILNFDVWSAYDLSYDSNWYHLKQVSQLPDDVVIATTEVGMVSVVNPDKRIIDLAGLNESAFAKNGFSADLLFSGAYRPDFLYMPFPHYEAMWHAIYENPFFREHYDYYPNTILGTDMGVAIYRDSAHYLELQKVMMDQ